MLFLITSAQGEDEGYTDDDDDDDDDEAVEEEEDEYSASDLDIL